MTQAKPRGSLLASFIKADKEDEIDEEVQRIADTVGLTNHLIFLLEDLDNPEKKILTYNALMTSSTTSASPYFTMRVHRKKQTNTLYTINALNLAIAAEHDGQTGKHLKLDWEKYRESLILAVNGSLVVHRVKVIKIYEISPEDAEV